MENFIFCAVLVAEFSKQNFEENSLEKLLEVCNKVLDMHAPRKSKFVRGSHSPFMNRELSKAIMTRTRFRNKFFKEKTVENRKNYNKHRNYCVTLLRKAKKKYYDSRDEKRSTDNITFWKTVKPFLSDKMVNPPKKTLVQKNEIINNEEKIAEIFDTYFTNIVSNFKIPLYQDTDFARRIDPFVGDDSITFILEKYKNHPSIIAIKLFCHENKTRRCFEKN